MSLEHKDEKTFCEGEEYAISLLFESARQNGLGAQFSLLLDQTGYDAAFFEGTLNHVPIEAAPKPEQPSRVTLASKWSELRAASLDGQSAVVFTPHAAGIQVNLEGVPAVLSPSDIEQLAVELFFIASESNE